MAENSKPCVPTQGEGACRKNTRAVIADQIKREQRKIEALQILHDELDWSNLTTIQEEVLWSFFISR